MLDIIAHLIAAPAFATLRTVEQLGYVVSAKAVFIPQLKGEMIGLSVTVQGLRWYTVSFEPAPYVLQKFYCYFSSNVLFISFSTSLPLRHGI